MGEKNFQLVLNYREAFESEKLEQRYNESLNKYDYIVGDWGYEMLRLKGFYVSSNRKAFPDERIDHLADYLQEYCNYGCAYFVLERKRAEGEIDAPVSADNEEERSGNKRRSRNRQRNRNNNRQLTDKQKSAEKKSSADKKQQPRQTNKNAKQQAKKEPKKAAKSTKTFTIREK